MSRRKSREQAFALLFEMSFSDLPIEQLVEAASEARDIEVEPFALSLAKGVSEKMKEIDDRIEANSHKWSRERISRVALAILRLAVYEMQYEDTVPVSVAINEAVELAKRYGGDEDASFVNGVLGGIAKEETV